MHQISTNVLWNLNLAMKMLTAGTLMDLTLVLVKRGTVETAPYAKVMVKGAVTLSCGTKFIKIEPVGTATKLSET